MRTEFWKGFWTGYLIAAIAAILSIVFIAPLANAADLIEYIIIDESVKQGLDPYVALAIAQLESSKNPKAVGPKGEIGLFQLRPEFVPIAARPLLFDVRLNTKLGVQKLIYYRANCPTRTGLDWIGCYNQGLRNPKYPQKLPYYKKFIRNLSSIQQ